MLFPQIPRSTRSRSSQSTSCRCTGPRRSRPADSPLPARFPRPEDGIAPNVTASRTSAPSRLPLESRKRGESDESVRRRRHGRHRSEARAAARGAWARGDRHLTQRGACPAARGSGRAAGRARPARSRSGARGGGCRATRRDRPRGNGAQGSPRHEALRARASRRPTGGAPRGRTTLLAAAEEAPRPAGRRAELRRLAVRPRGHARSRPSETRSTATRFRRCARRSTRSGMSSDRVVAAGGLALRYGGFYGHGRGRRPKLDPVRKRKFPIVGARRRRLVVRPPRRCGRGEGPGARARRRRASTTWSTTTQRPFESGFPPSRGDRRQAAAARPRMARAARWPARPASP